MSTASTGHRTRSTMRDVAALAGVGLKTVSRVVNDESAVSPAMRDRVQRAIAALDFQPNLGAGSLRRSDGKSQTLGLLLDAVDNPFSASINRAVEQVASARGTAVFAASSDDDPDRERQLVRAFTRRRVDGLIMSVTTDDQGYLAAEREHVPIVLVDREPTGLVADTVVTDNHEASRMATAHLITGGHRRIAHLADRIGITTARARTEGYEAAMRAEGFLVDPALQVHGLRSEAAAYDAVRALLEHPDPPTALYTSQNLITIGAIRALHALGRQHEIALVGFDDFTLADLLRPGVTVVAQEPATIGRRAAEKLFARLDGDTAPVERIVIPATLQVRGSGEIPPPA